MVFLVNTLKLCFGSLGSNGGGGGGGSRLVLVRIHWKFVAGLVLICTRVAVLIAIIFSLTFSNCVLICLLLPYKNRHYNLFTWRHLPYNFLMCMLELVRLCMCTIHYTFFLHAYPSQLCRSHKCRICSLMQVGLSENAPMVFAYIDLNCALDEQIIYFWLFFGLFVFLRRRRRRNSNKVVPENSAKNY